MSRVCLCRRLLIFPQGNKANFLSAYLDVADAEDQPLGWSRRAWFKLTLINQLDESKSVQKGKKSGISVCMYASTVVLRATVCWMILKVQTVV